MQHMFRIPGLLILGICSTFTSLAQLPANLVFEKFTGTWCGWCADGDLISSDLAAGDNRLIVINVHFAEGGLNDPMEAPETAGLEEFVNGTPSAMFNRIKFEDEFTLSTFKLDWQDYRDQLESTTTPFVLQQNHTFNPDTRELSVTVRATAIQDVNFEHRLNCFLLENNVSRPDDEAYHQTNYFNEVDDHPHFNLGDPIPDYAHQRVLRKMLGGTWGQEGSLPLTMQTNQNASYTFNFSVPGDWNENEMKIIAVVQSYSENSENRPISHAIEADLEPTNSTTSINILESENKFSLSISYDRSEQILTLTPEVEMHQSLQLIVFDLNGKLIQSHDAIQPDEQTSISTHDWASGVYILSYRTEAGSSSIKWVKW